MTYTVSPYRCPPFFLWSYKEKSLPAFHWQAYFLHVVIALLLPNIQNQKFNQQTWCRYANPLSIGTPISTMQELNISSIAMCQSPIYRDTHFYAYPIICQEYNCDHVSIPYLLGHPFLRQNGETGTAKEAGSVNPLSIGTPISTSRIERN